MISTTMSPLDVTRALYRSVREKDYATFAELTTPDLEWSQCQGFPGGGVHRGRDAVIREVLEAFGHRWASFGFEIGEMRATGDEVIVTGVYRARRAPDEREVVADACHVYTLRGGRIARFRQITDTKVLWDALGHRPETPIDIGLSHVALPVAALERSIAFYAEYAAMEVVHRREDRERGVAVAWLSDRTRPFAVVLIQNGSGGAVLGPPAHLGVGCASVAMMDARLDRARRDGILASEPQDSGPPVGYWAFIRDPDGHILELSYGQEIGITVKTGAVTS
jgi:ketosteroid isomerase-like protein/catechol 2,3-dioxygenase-like lactoylglutathione lyase family enzyme